MVPSQSSVLRPPSSLCRRRIVIEAILLREATGAGSEDGAEGFRGGWAFNVGESEEIVELGEIARRARLPDILAAALEGCCNDFRQHAAVARVERLHLREARQPVLAEEHLIPRGAVEGDGLEGELALLLVHLQQFPLLRAHLEILNPIGPGRVAALDGEERTGDEVLVEEGAEAAEEAAPVA